MSAHFLLSSQSAPSPTTEAPLLGLGAHPGPGHVGQRPGNPSLGAHERGIINGLAAYQLRYAKPEEALALLQLSSRLWPDDRQTLRLLCDGLLAIGDAGAAELAQSSYRRLAAAEPPSRFDRLREALIHAGRARLQEARAVLEGILGLGREGQRP
jgi:hypothetical protein